MTDLAWTSIKWAKAHGRSIYGLIIGSNCHAPSPPLMHAFTEPVHSLLYLSQPWRHWRLSFLEISPEKYLIYSYTFAFRSIFQRLLHASYGPGILMASRSI